MHLPRRLQRDHGRTQAGTEFTLINQLIQTTRFESPVNQCERALRHPESTVDADVQVLVLGLVLRAVLLRRPTGSGLKWYDRINLNVLEFTHASSQTLEPIELTW